MSARTFRTTRIGLLMSPADVSAASDPAPGGLLYELERRQDDVLAQLDALDAQVELILRGLGVRVATDDGPADFGALES